MPEETIHKLATEIVNQTILNNWVFYIILACITVVLSAAGSFFSAYFAKRAEQRAISVDFEEIKRQLRESTSLTESVKAEINRLSERSEKLEWLKRKKLEDYFIAVLRGVEYLSRDMYHRFFDAPEPTPDNPMVTASMLQRLYLPELDAQHAALLSTVSEFQRWVASGMQQRLTTPSVAGVRPSPSQSHMDQYAILLAKLNANVLVIEDAAKGLARELNKV